MVSRLHTRLSPILLLCGIVASGTGCQVVGIPSYRADSPGVVYEPLVADGGVLEGESYGQNNCPPGVLPPLPGWLAALHARKEAWKAERDLPQPAAYPRFLPLPTRPMFSPPRPEAAANYINTTTSPYGHWPSAAEGGMVTSRGIEPAMPSGS